MKRLFEHFNNLINEFGFAGPVKIVRFMRKGSRGGYGVDSINYEFHDPETGGTLNFGWSAVGDYAGQLLAGSQYKIQWWNTTNTASWGQSSGWRIIGKV